MAANIWKQTREGVDKITSALYNNVPNQVRGALEGVGRPGTLVRHTSLGIASFWYEYQMIVMLLGVVLVGGITFYQVKSHEFLQDIQPSAILGGGLAILLVGSWFFRRRVRIDPDGVYRIAMQRLHRHPSVLEVLGSPVVGSESKAYVITGGDIRMKGIYPARRPRRLQMIFPLRGPQRRGLVSVETKKRKGQYQFNLLALDVPSPGGGEERLFIIGNQDLYERGHIMNELRVPFIQALSLRDSFDEEDDADDVKDAQLRAIHPSIIEKVTDQFDKLKEQSQRLYLQVVGLTVKKLPKNQQAKAQTGS